MPSLSLPTPEPIAERLAALEAQVQNSQAQAQADRDRIAESEIRLMQSERKLRVTWTVSTLAAVVMLSVGWHKDAIAQGYGMTLAQAATRIAALETKTQDISRITDPNTNQPTVRFTNVNVQVVNGAESTEGASNGTGNLIIGYNELRGGGDVRTGSHNLVVGLRNNYSVDAGAVIGYQNTISNYEACVVGGSQNTASGVAATVSGGFRNTASSNQASVSGGSQNTASSQYSSVSGGYQNTVSGQYSSVSGGYLNRASGDYSSVSGGIGRIAPNQLNWVAGTQAVQ